jgi:hypothetical protein
LIEIGIIAIISILALIASFLLPNRKSVEKGDIPKYEESKSNAVYAIGSIVLVSTLVYFFLIIGNINLLTIINSIFFVLIGIGILAVNRSILHTIKERSMEILPAPTPGLTPGEVPVDVVTPSGPQTQTAAAGDIGIKIRTPISQAKAQEQAQTRGTGKQLKVGCPRCNGVITIDTGQPKIICPYCGFEGGMG